VCVNEEKDVPNNSRRAVRLPCVREREIESARARAHVRAHSRGLYINLNIYNIYAQSHIA